MAPRLTSRIVELLRLMHAGVHVTVQPKGTAAIDTARLPQTIRRETVQSLVADDLATVDAQGRLRITETGRDAVRVRDDISTLLRSA